MSEGDGPAVLGTKSNLTSVSDSPITDPGSGNKVCLNVTIIFSLFQQYYT